MGKKMVVNHKASAPSEVPRRTRRIDIIDQVGEGRQIVCFEACSKAVGMGKVRLIEAVLHKKVKTNMMAGEVARISVELVTRRTGLRTNVLKGNNRRCGRWFGGEVMANSFTL